MNEFELIRTFFASQPVKRRDVIVGIGDDAAVCQPPTGNEIVITTDVLVADVHFLSHADPVAIGHKALAVNLSDLAAMGAQPAWFTLNLSLPRADTVWLASFCEGMFSLARRHGVQLIGGDTTRGPLTVGIAAYGLVPAGQALLRSGAKVGDRVYVSGVLGDAGLALMHQRGEVSLTEAEIVTIAERLTRPMPRVEEGAALRAVANSAIDISDGLIADLGHILQASGVGARIRLDQIPISSVYRSHVKALGWDVALANGDDYELCFTVAPEKQKQVDAISARLGCPLTYIGDVANVSGLEVVDAAGARYRPSKTGYDHFAPP